MNIELKNIKHFPALSQDTPAYAARIYLDNVWIANTSNQGSGGPDKITPQPHCQILLKKVEEWCKLQPPELIGNVSCPFDLEALCGNQLAKHLTRQDMLKVMKRKVLVQTKDKKIMEYSWVGVKAIARKHIDSIKREFADVTVLNDLPVDAALELYMETE